LRGPGLKHQLTLCWTKTLEENPVSKNNGGMTGAAGNGGQGDQSENPDHEGHLMGGTVRQVGNKPRRSRQIKSSKNSPCPNTPVFLGKAGRETKEWGRGVTGESNAEKKDQDNKKKKGRRRG